MSELKKIDRGVYSYKGYKVYNCGYHQPDHSDIWEARELTDDEEYEGYVMFKGFTRKEIISQINRWLMTKL
jgi:hypothetical protein